MVSKAPSIEDILPQFCEFVGGDVIVGHNVNFDINFIYDNLMECSNKAFENEFIDLLRIARKTLPELKNHKLKFKMTKEVPIRYLLLFFLIQDYAIETFSYF